MGEPKGFIVVPIGFGPSDDLRSLELDSADTLKVAFDAAAQGLVGPHGWISGAWQKNPLAFGYSDGVYQRVSFAGTGLATEFGDTATVPSGEIWVITHISCQNIDGPSTQQAVQAFHGADGFNLAVDLAAVAGQHLNLQGWWVLEAGDYIRFYWTGTAAGNRLRGYVMGFSVDIDQ
jgi:hypothetical protein